ncbi:hypothetical protein [Pantoea sp. B65]|uniref:hypothetical protein n=1 Tax=Pantoea sp. B65 TaxID=2813359 RepID=UPI0039B41841
MTRRLFPWSGRADGAAFRFPGSADVYQRRLAQFTDARVLARASLWAALSDKARGEAFNCVSPPFRWNRIWQKVAARFSLETGTPVPFSLATHMPALAPVWQRISSGLLQPDYARAVNWQFGDFVFGADFDVISDITKIQLAGFTETCDPAKALIAAIETQIAAGVIPPL